MADYREIIRAINKREFAPVYILYGEEPYYIDKIVDALESLVVAEEDREFDQTTLFGADANAGMVMEAAGRFPMMSPLRFVALKEAQSMQHAKAQVDKLSSYVSNPNPMTVLVVAFKDKLGATSEILKAAKKNKDVVVFNSQKIADWNIGKTVKEFCSNEKIPIEEAAIELLVANVGSSLSNIFSEIEKLKVVVKDGGQKITAQLVADHIGVSREFNNFELTKALARRDYFQAINIVKHFEVNPKNNPTVVTSAVIFNFYQKLLLAAFSPDKSDKGLMETLQLKSSYALREIKDGLSRYNASQLVNAIHAIREFDVKSKGVGSFQKEYPLLLELIFRLLTL